jgi:competence protein ComEC
VDRPRSLTQVATPAGGGPPSERSGRNIRSRSLWQDKARAPGKFVIAPLAPLLGAMAIGIVADRWFIEFTTNLLAGILLALGVIAILTNRRIRVCYLVLLAAFAVAGAAWHHCRWSDMSSNDLARSTTETPRPAWVRGVVREARGVRHQRPGFGFGASVQDKVTTRFVLDITSVCDGRRWYDASGRAIVVVTGDRSTIRAGQAVETAGQVATLAPPLNPGEFDYRAYMRAQGIRVRLSVDDPESFWPDLGAPNRAFEFWLDSHRHRIRAWLFDQLDPSTAPLAAALLLGWREEIDPEVNDAFARTGTTHLLAVSGLQLQALAVALLVVFRVIGAPRRPAYVIVALTMLGYGILVGSAPSVVRSTVMTLTFCLAATAQRMARPANTLSLAALLTLGINPTYLFDVGCQLSFLAIATLVWLVSPACALVRHIFEEIRCRWFGPRSALDDLERLLETKWRKALRRATGALFDGIVASTVVWLAALPLVALRFHLVSPIGILLNIPLIPLTSAAMLLGGLSLVLSALWGPLGAPLAWTTARLLGLTQTIVLWGVAQPLGHRFVVGPTWRWVLIFYVFLAVAALTARKITQDLGSTPLFRFDRVILWGFVAAWIVPGWWLADVFVANSTLAAEFLAVGHGLAVFIHLPDGHTLLYDCGRLGDPTVGRRIVAPALWARGVGRIDTVYLSHADQDHYDGLPDLIDRFQIREVRIPPGFAGPENPLATQLVEQLRAKGIPVRPLTAPRSWDQAGVQFTVLHPSDGWHPETSDNSRSLVLDIGYRGRHLLLTGDLEQLGLDELVERPPPDPPPDVFLSPHHGGRTANPEWLYAWAKPRLVVVSQRPVGVSAGDALAPIERDGIPLMRTWRHGSIRFTWTDSGIAASAFLDDSAGAPDDPRRAIAGSSIQSVSNTVPAGDGHPARRMRLLIACTGFALGAITCVVLAVIEFAAWVLIAPPRSIASGSLLAGDPSNVNQEFPGEPIAIRTSDGARLAGRWLVAPGPLVTGKTVVLLHGFAEASSALEARRAAALSRHGWNVAVLDSRGYGQSDGPFSTFGGRETGDIHAWLHFLAERTRAIDPQLPFCPVLWGRSMGAAIAIRTAAAEAPLAALVLESPMVDLNISMALVLKRRMIPFPKLMARLVTRRAGRLAGVPIHAPRPIDSARQVTCPTLILHGTNDTVVSIDEARRLAGALPAPPHWIEVADARHTDVVDKGGEVLLNQIAAFLDEAAKSAVAARMQVPGAS